MARTVRITRDVPQTLISLAKEPVDLREGDVIEVLKRVTVEGEPHIVARVGDQFVRFPSVFAI